MVMAQKSNFSPFVCLTQPCSLLSRLCQHRWAAFSGMVAFHNTVSGALTNPTSGGSQQFAFGRGTPSPTLSRYILRYLDYYSGSMGFVAINNEDSPWTATFQTSLPAGTYCDVVAGPASNGACAGSSYVASATILFHFKASSDMPCLLRGAFLPRSHPATPLQFISELNHLHQLLLVSQPHRQARGVQEWSQ
jgi:Alpha amylase, C-terminal all-beta domain